MNRERVASFVETIFPLLILALLVPFSVVFDSVMYLMTRPTCLNCGSLAEYVRSSSLTGVMVASVVGHAGIHARAIVERVGFTLKRNNHTSDYHSAKHHDNRR